MFMRRALLTTFAAFAFALNAGAEAVKLKTGMIINGSIVGQTEYVLSLQTSYGTIAINQREVEAILPDLHRVLLKGGGEFVGTVLDMDSFNLSLKTDKGVVNIDVAQIASMEIYDYDEAHKQQKYVQQKVELEQAALKDLQNATAAQAAEAAAGGSLSTSGLSYDPDLERTFPSKPTVVQPQQAFNYHLNTFTGQEVAPEAQPEPETVPALDEEETTEQAKIKDSSKNYFALFAGGYNTGLKLKNLSPDAGDMQADLSGTQIGFGAEYKRRMNNFLWVGGSLSMGVLPKKYITVVPKEHEMKISGQAIDINIYATLYLNPKSKMRLYLLGGAGVNMLSIDKNSATCPPNSPNASDCQMGESESAGTTSFSALGGVGIERSIGDINLGLEVRSQFAPYSGDLGQSRSYNIFALLKASWFFR